MHPDIIAVFIPIIFLLVTGLILVTYFYLRSRERQMLIEKGLDAQSIKEFFEQKKDPTRLTKIGLIIFFFGLGLGLGLMLEDATSEDYWVPFTLFTITGLGFVVANLVSKKME
jgi:hypothetical protein